MAINYIFLLSSPNSEFKSSIACVMKSSVRMVKVNHRRPVYLKLYNSKISRPLFPHSNVWMHASFRRQSLSRCVTVLDKLHRREWREKIPHRNLAMPRILNLKHRGVINKFCLQKHSFYLKLYRLLSTIEINLDGPASHCISSVIKTYWHRFIARCDG